MKDFLKTLPGILTGIAAVVTAATTLYLTVIKDNESQRESLDEVADLLPAPRPIEPLCNSAQKWPPDNSFFIVRWSKVEGASTYVIEYDCRDSRQGIGGWHGTEEEPWKVIPGVAKRMMHNPMHSSKVHLEMKRENADTMRWRVWAVDHNDQEGQKSDWCQVTFF